MEEALRIQKGIGVVFAHSDAMAFGAGEAIDAFQKGNSEEKDIVLIGVGGNIEGLAASVSLKPLVRKAVEVAKELVSNPELEPEAQIIVAPNEVITGVAE